MGREKGEKRKRGRGREKREWGREVNERLLGLKDGFFGVGC